MRLLRTLIERDKQHAKAALPPELRDLYDGDLHFPSSRSDRPFVIGNFVSTLDGVVSFKVEGHAGGSTISGSDLGDRFIMGLLRASADAVMVGSRTVHDVSPMSLWIPEFTYPDAKQLYTEYRINVLHKTEYPLTVIVSGSGKLDLQRAVFRTRGIRTIVITTPTGSENLAKAGAAELTSVEVHAVDAQDGSIHPRTIMQLLHSQLGIRMLLHEGGPTLFGQFLAAQAVDELFLTLSPQIAGRAKLTNRPGVVENIDFSPASAPWFELLTLKEKSEHLYLRYRRAANRQQARRQRRAEVRLNRANRE